jgi:hypothetical protein
MEHFVFVGLSAEPPTVKVEPSFLTNRDDPKKRIWLKAHNYGNFEQKYCWLKVE